MDMKLSEYLKINGIRIGDFASKIGVTEQAVYKYVRGERLPRPAVMAAISAESGGAVTSNDFYGVCHADSKSDNGALHHENKAGGFA